MRFRSATGSWFLGAIVVAWITVVLLVLVMPRPATDAAVRFQRTTGGLGIGAVMRPGWCFHALDPRIEIGCPTELRPLPGIVPYCPYETMSVTGGGATLRRP